MHGYFLYVPCCLYTLNWCSLFQVRDNVLFHVLIRNREMISWHTNVLNPASFIQRSQTNPILFIELGLQKVKTCLKPNLLLPNDKKSSVLNICLTTVWLTSKFTLLFPVWCLYQMCFFRCFLWWKRETFFWILKYVNYMQHLCTPAKRGNRGAENIIIMIPAVEAWPAWMRHLDNTQTRQFPLESTQCRLHAFHVRW